MGSWSPGQSSGSEYSTVSNTDLHAKIPLDDHPRVYKLAGPQMTDPVWEEWGVQVSPRPASVVTKPSATCQLL